MRILESFLEILSDLIPDRSQPNHVWMSRVILLICASIGFWYLCLYSIRGTALGEKYGINPLETGLTRIEYAKDERKIIGILTDYKKDNLNVKEIYSVALYNKKNNKYEKNLEIDDTSFFTFAWSEPQFFEGIRAIDNLFEENKRRIFEKRNVGCFSGDAERFFLGQKEYERTTIIYCPVKDSSLSENIAFTIGFYSAINGFDLKQNIYKQEEMTGHLHVYLK